MVRKTIGITILLLLLFSCSPEKRVARLLKKHPELIHIDTVWHKDTTIIEGASKDSTFHFYQNDTIVLNDGRLHVKYYFNHDSTVYLQGKCDPDTVIKEIPIQVNSVAVKDGKWYDDALKYFWFLLFLLTLYGLWRIFAKH